MKIRRRVATRSALALARKALAVSSAALPAYASPFSKRDFTQPQLFALLCLKQFLCDRTTAEWWPCSRIGATCAVRSV